jgi:hypothetical protein
MRVTTVAATLLVIFFATDAAARQAGTGATITGQVTDASGAVLPGVTVTATSPALSRLWALGFGLLPVA